MVLADLIRDQSSEISARQVAVVVAHPDDETIGCGAQLARWRGVVVVVATDGAPKDLVDAHKHDFATANAYAHARSAELEEALRLAGVPRSALVRLNIPDQQAAAHLADLAQGLAILFEQHGARVAVTHAYEGGHPDHDAVAFAVHAAALARSRSEPLMVVEMPLYRLGERGMILQSFVPAREAEEVVVPLSGEQQALKRQMVAAHRTQAKILAPFPVDAEKFRIAPRYDFTALPNNGQLEYERHHWGWTGARWLDSVCAAQAELRQRAGPC